jgi:hypothetical protein
MQVLENGGIPHQGNSTSGSSGPGMHIDQNTRGSLTISPLGVKIERQTQTAANHVLSQIPLVKRHPVLQGSRTRDIFAEFDQSPKDIEVLGFWLVDPELKRPPAVWINNIALAPKFVSAYVNHLDIERRSS